MQYRVRPGYTVVLQGVAHEGGTVLDLATEEARSVAHKLESPADAAKRLVATEEDRARRDAEARTVADAKYADSIKRLRDKTVAEILRTNPALAQAIAEAWQAAHPADDVKPSKKAVRS